MTISVVIPYLSQLWSLEDCIESFGPSDIPILIVDNSPGNDTKACLFPRNNVRVHVASPINIGISAAWNLGIKEGADQTLICSQTVRFAPAEHSRRKDPWGLDHVAGFIRRQASPYGITFGDQGYHLVSVGRQAVETVGLFDENFLAYGEDDDYCRRLRLANICQPDCGDWTKTGIFSIAFATQKRAGTIITTKAGRQRNYYDFKWCSSPDKYPGDYNTPFGNPNNPLSFWPEVIHR